MRVIVCGWRAGICATVVSDSEALMKSGPKTWLKKNPPMIHLVVRLRRGDLGVTFGAGM